MSAAAAPMDWSVTTPAHLNWILRKIGEVRYSGWGDDEPCALPSQPGATVDAARVSRFVCSRVLSACPALESRRQQLQAIMDGRHGRAVVADIFWILFLEFFALSDGVARLTAFQHVVGNLMDEVHAACEDNESCVAVADERLASIVDTALRQGVPPSPLTQGFLSVSGAVTMDVTGVQRSAQALSSSAAAAQSAQCNVSRVPLPQHLTPKILDDVDGYDSRPASRASAASLAARSSHAPRGGPREGSADSAPHASRADSDAGMIAPESSAAWPSGDPFVGTARGPLRRGSRDGGGGTAVGSGVVGGSGSASGRRVSGGGAITNPATPTSATTLATKPAWERSIDQRRQQQQAVVAADVASSRFIRPRGGGNGTQGDASPEALLARLELGGGGTAATQQTAGKPAAAANAKAAANTAGACSEGNAKKGGRGSRASSRASSAGSANSTIGGSSCGSAVCALTTRKSARKKVVLCSRASSLFLGDGSAPSMAPASLIALVLQVGAAGASAKPQFGMSRAVLEEVVRSRLQDKQFKPYSGRTDTTAAVRVLRDAGLLDKQQARRMLLDKMVTAVDAESTTQKRGIVLAAMGCVAEEQNRLFSRVSASFTALMKQMSSRGHVSSVAVPRDMVLPVLSDALAQAFCALAFDCAPYLRAELRLDTRRAVKRHVSFWLDGVDRDDVGGWDAHWSRSRLLHRCGAERTTLRGVVVGTADASQLAAGQAVRFVHSPGGTTLGMEPVTPPPRGQGGASGGGAAGPSSSAATARGGGGSARRRRRASSSPSRRRAQHQSNDAAMTAMGGGGVGARGGAGGGAILGGSIGVSGGAGGAPTAMVFAGCPIAIPPQRNVRVELLRTFTHVDDSQLAEREAERSRQRAREARLLQQHATYQSNARLTRTMSRMPINTNFSSGGGGGGGGASQQQPLSPRTTRLLSVAADTSTSQLLSLSSPEAMELLSNASIASLPAAMMMSLSATSNTVQGESTVRQRELATAHREAEAQAQAQQQLLQQLQQRQRSPGESAPLNPAGGDSAPLENGFPKALKQRVSPPPTAASAARGASKSSSPPVAHRLSPRRPAAQPPGKDTQQRQQRRPHTSSGGTVGAGAAASAVPPPPTNAADTDAIANAQDDDGDDYDLRSRRPRRMSRPVGARDVMKALESADAAADARRREVRDEGIATRKYADDRRRAVLVAERLRRANDVAVTHRFAPANRPDEPWHRFGSHRRPPPSVTQAMTQGTDFFAEGEFAVGLLSPVVERFCEEQQLPCTRAIALKFPSKMAWSFLVRSPPGAPKQQQQQQ